MILYSNLNRMNMKKISIVAFALLTSVFTAFAQTSDAEAEGLMKEAAAFLEKGSVEMEVIVGVNPDGSGFISTLKMDKEKFCFTMFDDEIWYDGKTQWYYRCTDALDGLGELYISEPTAEELEATNPFIMLKNWKKHFTAKMLKQEDWPAVDYGKKAVKALTNAPAYGVKLISKDAGAMFTSAVVYFDKDKRIRYILPAAAGGDMQLEVGVNTAKNGVKYDVKTFVCNMKIDSDTEVIDMR